MQSIYIGNLDLGTTEETIRSLIEPYGNANRITFKSGRSRCVAFVKMDQAGDASKAVLGLDGAIRSGRPLHVKYGRSNGTAHDPHHTS